MRYLNLQWMIRSGMRMRAQKQVMTTWGVVMGSLRPILVAKSCEVSLRRINPPTRIPNTYDQDWIMLDLWASVIYFTMREWRAMFWSTIPTIITILSAANICAYSSFVKKEPMKRVIPVSSWLMTIQVFLFPYSMLLCFSKKGPK